MDIQSMCDDLSDSCPNERYLCKKCKTIWGDLDKLEEDTDGNGNHKNCGGETVRQIPSGITVDWMDTRW